jgi:phytanoyl-CoA hydroxylase
VENALTRAEVDAILEETVHICKGERGDIIGMPDFDPTDSDEQVISRIHCIHFPHKISEMMKDAMAHPAIVDVLTKIIAPDVKSMQSMLFVKAAGKPGQAWHQDEDFIPTRDRSLTGAWIALDDATVDNGCLWVIPGSHKAGILWEMEEQENPDFDCTDESVGFPYKDEDAIPVEVPAGSIVFFNGYTLHRSLPNVTEDRYRRALVNHYMSASSLLPWRPVKEGEYISTLDFRDIVMIAGKDPYPWKGYEDIHRPQIRPSRMGGCKWVEPEENAVAAGD